MRFLNRVDEQRRLEALLRDGGLAVVWGRRRVGKTRLLVEWARQHGGVYAVADQSAAEVQRRHVANAIAERLPGFGDVAYPDWGSLLARLARDARAARFRGPIVLDELPYLAVAAPQLPSILQRWIDHEARDAKLAVALAGSSQRMMQGLVLDATAPLFGRARVAMQLAPLGPEYLSSALGPLSGVEIVEAWTAWGGVPRYLELAATSSGTTLARVDDLVLDPNGPLHTEPERMLLEELPAAMEVRPLLDAIGAGAHRLSEIAGRLGRPATSLSRPLERLIGMGLVVREVPYGEPPRAGKRSLYRIADPFFRLWFRVVAPHRAALVAGGGAARAAILSRHWDALAALGWEELCRKQVSRVPDGTKLHMQGPWGAAVRHWAGNGPEWDLVADAIDGSRVLVGEAKLTRRPPSRKELEPEIRRLLAKPLPAPLVTRDPETVLRALFVPAVAPRTPREIAGVAIVTCADLLGKPLSASGRARP